MTTSGVTRFVLRNERDLERLLERFASGDVASCIVEVPVASTALVAARDWHRLVAAVEGAGVSIALRVDPEDRLRHGFASLLNLPLEENSARSERGFDTSVADAEIAPAPGTDGRGDQGPIELGVRPSVDGVSRSPGGTLRSPTGTIVIAREDTEAPRTAVRARTGVFTGSGHSSAAKRLPGRRSSGSEAMVGPVLAPLGRMFVATCVLLLATAMGAILVLLLAPRATVVLVPETRSLSLVLTYGVLGGEREPRLDLAFPPREIERRISVDLVAPASGERFEPDGTATGQVDVINPYPRPVTFPAGTALVGENGIAYVTMEEVTVPAADPFGSLSFGTARVSVKASVPGPDGNADPGAVTGQLDSGVFYRNLEAISGGTLRRISLVTESDIEALQQRARTELMALVEPAVHESLEPGEQLLAGSLEIGEPTFAFSHQPGDAAEQVRVHAALTVRGRAYDPALVHQQAKDEAGRRLARLAGPHEVVLGNTLVISEPHLIGSSGLAWRLTARGQARRLLTEEQLARARQVVLGKSLTDAEAAISQLEGVAAARVTLQPDWLPRRMPAFASQIEVIAQSE
jgi:hypothetical protein